tara:strand:+ start:1522 stop:2775 length:1254 start_codon:yes stop_codon:yes gene_type:complete
MLFLYRLLIYTVLIISPLIIFFRIIKGKEDSKRYLEKFSIKNYKRPGGNLIWFHGSSVGEVLSIIPVIKKLEKSKKINKILITSSTLSSSKIISKLYLKKTIHQFYPIDNDYITHKFLNHWKPNLVIFLESEIWPVMINNIKKRNIPLLLINARITQKTFKNWKKILPSAKNIFSKFDKCLVQNDETFNYLKILGAKNISKIGNLKFIENKEEFIKNNKKFKKLEFLNFRKIWCASSTHEGEEEICIEAHKVLRNKYKKLLTIIIPRHVDRIQNIIDICKRENLSYFLHSKSQKVSEETDIYLVDTYGETKSFYLKTNITFMGGSIAKFKKGGQNPLEAIRLNNKILYGPNVQNFKEIYKFLNNNNLAFKFNNKNQLIDMLNLFLNKKTKKINNLYKLNRMGSNILKKTLIEIKAYI